MRTTLLNRGFASLIVTQFFGAANDNVLKGVLTYMVIDGAWEGRLGSGGQGVVMLSFTIPFILLSGFAGQVCDRHSKRTVSVWVKIVELPIALIGLVGFMTHNLWVTLASLIALACQSSFFGPAKYGMIPELVDNRDLSRANGAINMLTNVAVIAGTYAAGLISDHYSPQVPVPTSPVPGVPPAPTGATGATAQTVAGGVLWLPGVCLLLLAAAGLCAVLFLPRLKAGDRNVRYHSNPLTPYLSALADMKGSPILLTMCAWGYFYLLAGMALLIIPEYTVVLNITREKASLLLGVMAIAIGIGCAFTGLISGPRIRPSLVPVGACGLSLFMLLLGLIQPTFNNVAIFIAGAGFFAGFYIVPLQALIQHLAPPDERGRFLGTANGMSFSFLAIASALYWLIRGAFGNDPQRIFIISAALMIIGFAFFSWRMRARGFTFAALGGDDNH